MMPDYPLPALADQYRLMAAAPDLLAICLELVESAEYWGEYDVPIGIVDRLNAAIAKAGGPARAGPTSAAGAALTQQSSHHLQRQPMPEDEGAEHR